MQEFIPNTSIQQQKRVLHLENPPATMLAPR